MQGLSDAVENGDFYSLLNVSKQASQEELRLAYRKLCMQFHPDKHHERYRKEAADVFNKIQTAYDVLSDSNKRHIYDIYGRKGLEADWQIVERKKTAQEIIEEYEDIQRKKKLKALEEVTHPESSFSMRIDATSLISIDTDFEDDEFYEDGINLPEISEFSLSQSIQAPLTTNDTVTMSGFVKASNGNGSGEAQINYRHHSTQHMTSEVQVGISDSRFSSIAYHGYYQFGRGLFTSVSLPMHAAFGGSTLALVFPGVSAVVGNKIGDNVIANLQWSGGKNHFLATNIIYENHRLQLRTRFQIGIPHSFIRLSTRYRFPELDAALKVILKFGTFGFIFECGGEHKISQHSIVSSSVAVSIPYGVSLKLRLNRSSQSFFIPILLSDDVNPIAIFYAAAVPLTVYIALQKLIIQPYIKRKKIQQENLTEQTLARDTESEKNEAAKIVTLMKESTDRIVENETRKRGLIIIEAWYGKLVNSTSSSHTQHVIDVKVPLQNLIENSALRLPPGISKTGIPGFYDPCPGSDKSLKIIYNFRGKTHHVLLDDKDSLRIPLKSHLTEDAA